MCYQNCGTDVIDILMLIATFLAVVVALFDDEIQSQWFGPKISLTLGNPQCELNTMNNGKKVWYYHLKVSNSHKAVAHNSVVILSKIDEIWEGGTKPIWQGEVPLFWIFPEVYQTYTRNIGADQYSDFFSVSQEGLELRTAFFPNNMKKRWDKPCNIKLTVFVKSDEGSSTPIAYTVAWDGEWDEGITEMSQHVSIS